MDYYDENQIDKFSMIKKQKDTNNWSTQSESDIMSNIRDSEDFQQYAQQ